MTLNEYIQICEKYGLIAWYKWMDLNNSKFIRPRDLVEAEPDYGIIENNTYYALVGYRKMKLKTKTKTVWKNNSLIAYGSNYYATNIKEAENIIINLLKERKNKNVKKRLDALNKDF